MNERSRPNTKSSLNPIYNAINGDQEEIIQTFDLNNQTNNESNLVMTAHDWESYKQKDVFDDGTLTYFWRAHTLTVLFVVACGLVYVALFESTQYGISDSQLAEYNTKRGLVAVILSFLLFGVTQIPDGPFQRPHPALWRCVLCLTILYELALIFILFQTPSDARQLLTYIDSELGKPLAERDYGGNCKIYDTSRKDDPFHNIWDKFDVMVVMHFFGWWVKTLILRDLWLCTVLSIMFELLEYTLEHQLPNFSECWWDHWVLDALICNGLGIYVGTHTLHYLKMKSYDWRGLWNITSYRGKLKRIAAQFGPHSWIEFDWRPTSSLGRWLWMLFIIFVMLLAELNTFYLKFVLWLPPAHIFNLLRVILLAFAGAVSLRETFQYLDDPNCSKFGRQAWVTLALIITEFLIIIKFDLDTVLKPLPTHVLYAWIGGIMTLIFWTTWNFFFSPCKRKDQLCDKSSEKKLS